MALDRKTGKVLWQQVAKVALPHEGYLPYGSSPPIRPSQTASRPSPTPAESLCYGMDVKKLWERDFGVPLRMHMTFGEGAWPVIEGSKLLVLFDDECASFLVAMDVATGKHLWRAPGPTATPTGAALS